MTRLTACMVPVYVAGHLPWQLQLAALQLLCIGIWRPWEHVGYDGHCRSMAVACMACSKLQTACCAPAVPQRADGSTCSALNLAIEAAIYDMLLYNSLVDVARAFVTFACCCCLLPEIGCRTEAVCSNLFNTIPLRKGRCSGCAVDMKCC